MRYAPSFAPVGVRASRLGGRTANSASRRSAYGMRPASPQSVSALSASAARPVPRLSDQTANSAARRSACGMRPASPQSVVRTFRIRSAFRVPCLGGRTAQSGLAAFRIRYAPSFAAVGVRASRIRSAFRVPCLGDRTTQSGLAAFRFGQPFALLLIRYALSFAAVGCPRFPRPQCFPFPASVAEQRIQPRGVPHAVCAQLRRSRLSPLSASAMLSVSRLGAGAAALTPASVRGFCSS